MEAIEEALDAQQTAIQLIDERKQFHQNALAYFNKCIGDRDVGLSYHVISVFGSQSSGKSTLLNYLFNTTFDTMDAQVKRQQTTKLERTLQRFRSKIEAGDFYEAHQTLRTIANRYVRAKSYQDAIDLISEGSFSFLKAGQGGSGTDLVFYLLEVYDLAQVTVNDSSVSRLVKLLVAIDPQEPNLKDVITGMNNWSIKFSDFKFGDPFLHNVIGTKLIEGGYPYDAERYLMLGTHESVQKYVNLIWEWFTQENDSASVGDFLSRLIFNYLFISNIAWAYEARDKFLQLFVDKFSPEMQYRDV